MTTFTCDNVPDQVTFLSCTITQASSIFPTELLSAAIGLVGVGLGTAATIIVQRSQAIQQRQSEQRNRLAAALSKSFKVRDLLSHIWKADRLPKENRPPQNITLEQIHTLNADFVAFQEIIHEIQLIDDDKIIELAEDLFDACGGARNYYFKSRSESISPDVSDNAWDQYLAAIEPKRIALRKQARLPGRSNKGSGKTPPVNTQAGANV